jgi:hypothetical protein
MNVLFLILFRYKKTHSIKLEYYDPFQKIISVYFPLGVMNLAWTSLKPRSLKK